MSHEAVFQLAKPQPITTEKIKVTLAFQSPHPQHNIGRFRLSVTGDDKSVENWVSAELQKLLATPAKDRTPEQQTALVAYYRDRAGQTQPQRAKVQQLNSQKQQLEAQFPSASSATRATRARSAYFRAVTGSMIPARSSSRPRRRSWATSP